MVAAFIPKITGFDQLWAPDAERPDWPRRIAFAALVLVIALTAAAAAYWFLPRPWHGVPVLDFPQLLSDAGDPGLPVALNPESEQPFARSGVARGVWLGARVVDLEVASQWRNEVARAAYYARDPVAQGIVAYNSDLERRLAAQISGTLAGMRNHLFAQRMYQYVRWDGMRAATVGQEISLGRRYLEGTGDPGPVALGNWLETVRIAARRGDRAFFATTSSHEMAAITAKLHGIRSPARKALARVRELLAVTGPLDLRAVERAAADALTELTAH
jgi:hypothetical protein